MTRYTGTWPLVRVALRRDRVIASVWVLLLVVVVYASAAATENLYPTVADRVTAAEAIALLFLVLIRRHTRTEEESGRAELLGGTAVGRDAQLAAAVLESVLVALVLGVLAAAASAAGGLPVAGSIAAPPGLRSG